MSNMNKVATFIFLLLWALGLTHSFPVTARQGGNRSARLFFCVIQGCAANVTHAFCNDVRIFSGSHIANCAGPLTPNAVCQHDGRAFLSTDTDGDCEFEGKVNSIDTKKCKDDSPICAFATAPTSPPVTTNNYAIAAYTVAAVLVLGLIFFSVWLCKKRRQREQQPASDTDGNVPLREVQRPEDGNGRDTRGGPGLDDGSSPSQHDHGS
ncbi:uncharacterized protein [Chaetodon trifascialis]|uniref:uncharacterized protein n=1 Tax=Chaetodon trifascialis TaxID=109706 RepID=UPI003991729C